MAVLEKIRVRLGVFITILIAVALLSFIIDPNTLSSTIQSKSKSNNVGEMNGKAVSYRDYFTEVENTTRLMEAVGGQSLNNEQAQNQVRNMAWQKFLSDRVFLPKVSDAGFAVSQAEMGDLFAGANVSPIIQNAFAGRDGFNPQTVADFSRQMDMDETGTSRKYWNWLEQQVYSQQMMNKYFAAFTGSTLLSKTELERAIAENNVTKDIDFVMLPIEFGVDSTMLPTSQEIEAYYKEHRENFRQPENRDIEYVMFEVTPSDEDKAEAEAVFAALYEEFQNSDNLKNFISLNSEQRWSDIYFSKDDLAAVPEFADYAFGSKDAVSAIRTEDLTLSAARVADRKVMPDSVFVYYTVAQPASVADSILNAIKKTNDGLTPMGWTTQEALAQSGMNEFGAAFDLKAGEATVVSLQGGQITAVIKVSETTRPKEKVKLAVLRKTISPSDDTYRSFLMQATELADAADGKYENFSRVVKEKGLPVIPSSRLQLETRRLGACDNARSVVQWAFDRKTKAGSVSDVITVDNKYHFVAAVTKARKEGYAPVSDVSSNIALALSTEKKVAALAEDCKSKISGSESIEAIAEKLGTTVSHRDGISFGMMNMSMDPALIGAVSVADKGVVTGPVKGAAGICYFVVNEVGEGSYYTEEDAKNRLMQTSSYALQSLPSILAEEAEVKDSRARFY